MNWKEIAAEINKMSANQQEQTAVVFSTPSLSCPPNVGEFAELIAFLVNDRDPRKTYIKAGGKHDPTRDETGELIELAEVVFDEHRRLTSGDSVSRTYLKEADVYFDKPDDPR